MTDEDEDGSGGDKVAAQLAEEKDKLTAELEDARSRLESKDEKLEQLEAQVAAKEAEEREALLAEIREAATEDFVEEHVDEDMGLPEIKALHTGLNAGPVEDDGDPEQEAGAERQTQAERGKGRQTVTSPTGEQVDLRAYNALREVYGLSPVEDGSDLHPDLHSAFHRAKQNRRGQARIVLPPNNGGGN